MTASFLYSIQPKRWHFQPSYISSVFVSQPIALFVGQCAKWRATFQAYYREIYSLVGRKQNKRKSTTISIFYSIQPKRWHIPATPITRTLVPVWLTNWEGTGQKKLHFTYQHCRLSLGTCFGKPRQARLAWLGPWLFSRFTKPQEQR